MSSRRYEIIIRSPLGSFMLLVNKELSCKWVINLNKPGKLTLELPAESCTTGANAVFSEYGIGDFSDDYRVEVWRHIPGVAPAMVGEGPFFVDYIAIKQDDDGRRIMYIEAETALGILWRRINSYNEEDPRSTLVPLPVDNQMKFVVRNNTDSSAGQYMLDPDPTRDISQYMAVQPDTSQVVEVYEGKISHQVVGESLKKMADYAFNHGEPVFFDIVQTGTSNPFLEFRTYVGQRGVDRTSQITLGPDTHTLSDYEIAWDWRKTNNRVYSGGSGKGAARGFNIAELPTLSADLLSRPFSLREGFQNANSEATEAAKLQTEAESVLQSKRQRLQISGTVNETRQVVYGRDIGFGDRVRVFVEGVLQDAIITTETGELNGGKEKIEATASTELNRSASNIGSLHQRIEETRRNLEYHATIERL